MPDSAILLLLLTLIVLTVLGGVGFAVYRLQYGEDAKFRRRAEMIAGIGGKKADDSAAKAGAGRRKAIQAKVKELEDKQKERKGKAGIQERLMQSGMDISVNQFYIRSVICGVVCCGLWLFKGYNPMALPFVLVATGLGLPRWYLSFKIGRRQKAFTQTFGDALDVIVRGIRTGLPVGECLAMIGRELPDPVGLEFRHITEGQKIGLTLDEVLSRGLVRMPTAEYKFFAIVMNIQQQTGGNLADTLNNLSSVLRERRKIKDKIKALSAEARASAAIIGSLPFIVAGLLYLVNQEYISRLFTDSFGHILIAGGLTWMALGVLVMWRMINFDF